MADAFDVVVIGGGPAGENAGARAAAAGLSVALIERELPGGGGSSWARVPSKALLRPAEALWLAGHAPGVPLALRSALDVREVLGRREQLVPGDDGASQVRWAQGVKLTVVRGHARLSGPRTVRVEDSGGPRELKANKAVVLATGSRPRLPDIPGLKEARPWDHRQRTATKAVPRRLLVLGGGAVAVELSQAWHSLGAEVTLVQRGPRLLTRFEPFVGQEVEQALRDSGITVHLGTQVTRVHRLGGTGEVTVTLSTGEQLRADELLVALGREARTDDLGLETVGLAPGQPVEVDDQLRAKGVEGGWLYACGDTNGHTLLTHLGKYQARLAGDHIGGKHVRARVDTKATPRVILTRPQVTSVGLTEAQAREQGLRVRAVQCALGDGVGTSLLGQGLGGTAKLVVDESRRVIVGATFTGPRGGELLHAATIAVAAEVPLDTLWHAVPSLPTVSEVWLRLLEAYGP